MAEKINIREWMLKNFPSHVLKNVDTKPSNNIVECNIIHNIDKYIDVYHEMLNKSKGVYMFNENSIVAEFENKEKLRKYIIINNIYIAMLEDMNISYEEQKSFQLLNELCNKVGFFPFKDS